MTIEEANALREKFKSCSYKLAGLERYTHPKSGETIYTEFLRIKEWDDSYTSVGLINYKHKTISPVHGYYKPNPVGKSLERLANKVGFTYSE